MVLANTSPQGIDIKGTIIMIKNVVMENTIIMMVRFIKDNFLMIKNTETEKCN
jgi:hypothetical protein